MVSRVPFGAGIFRRVRDGRADGRDAGVGADRSPAARHFFVVAHFHYVFIGGAVFPLFGALHYGLRNSAAGCYPKSWAAGLSR